jgi:hypothetical protein
MLGEINRILRNNAVAMERRIGVKSTATRLEVVNYQNEPMVEGFVEAEMDNGTVLCWCLDLTWTDDAFRIEATLDRNSSAGSETLKRLPTEVVHDVGDLPEALANVTRTAPVILGTSVGIGATLPR